MQHSYSAVMHNAAFAALGIDARYELLEVRPEELEQKFQQFLQQGILGFNVTVPYKEKIKEFLDRLDEEAALIGAVNTIKVGQGRLTEGFNTDGAGFIKHLTEIIGFDPAAKSVSILGAGGAARAIAVQLAKRKAGGISLCDLDRPKAEQLVRKLQSEFPACRLKTVSQADELLKEEPDLLINATTYGMHKDEALAFNPELFYPKLLVYDLIYNPAQTLLLRTAQRKGCRGVFNGLGMLLYQGVLAFQIWLDIEAPVEVMERSLKEALSKT